MKKTAKVIELLEKANRMLEAPRNEHHTTESKASICLFIEEILMDAGAYAGFGWIDTVDAIAVNCNDPDYYDRRYFTDRRLARK